MTKCSSDFPVWVEKEARASLNVLLPPNGQLPLHSYMDESVHGNFTQIIFTKNLL